MTTKSRLLFLQKYLFENTDDNHSISTNDLISVLETNGFKANRKTVKDDVEMLIDADYDILIEKDGKMNWMKITLPQSTVMGMSFMNPASTPPYFRCMSAGTISTVALTGQASFRFQSLQISPGRFAFSWRARID